MKKAVVVSGAGGQGVMSAGILLAQTAVSAGKTVTYLPEYGPEQRGGSAKCTVVINDGEIVSPLVHKCDYLIALNEISLKKFLPSLKPGGTLVINSSRVISEPERTDIEIVRVPADDLAAELGNLKAANLFMLGALTGASGIIPADSFRNNLEKKFAGKKPEIIESNLKAFGRGVEIASK